MTEETKVLDSDGLEVSVGSRVRIWDAAQRPSGEVTDGTVTEIEATDGDVDDEGRPFTVNPRIVVRFDDATVERFTTYFADGQVPWTEYPIWEVEEIDVLEPGL